MSSVELDSDQQAIAASVEGVVRRHLPTAGDDLRPLWTALAELGAFELFLPDGAGGALELVAATEALGRAGCPGPIIGTYIGAQLLEGTMSTEVRSGQALVGLVTGDLAIWGPQADVLIEVDGTNVWLVEPLEDFEPVATLAGDRWGKAKTKRLAALNDSERAFIVADLVTAAWVTGAAQTLLDLTAAHARSRVQFGRPIGDFQAVAHRLAWVHAELLGARGLTRLVARGMGAPGRDPVGAAAARVVSARAGLGAAYAAHQVFGAFGYSSEAGIGRMSTAIRQCSLLPPGQDRAFGLLSSHHPPALT